MSRRTAEANKAIKKAWERERDLVQNGKGTRDWTREQQEDILDPDKGKAYDEQGRAFEGQHMKSVAEYPEHQGNPDNIQFLTKEEHLEAHRGSWQNPTNWYYDPKTRAFLEFGESELVPCKVMDLSDPIVVFLVDDSKTKVDESKQIEKGQLAAKPNTHEESEKKGSQDQQGTVSTVASLKASRPIKTKQKEGRLRKVLRYTGKGLAIAGKFVGKVIIENPEIAVAVITGIGSKIASKTSSSGMPHGINTGTITKGPNSSSASPSSPASISNPIDTVPVADVADKIKRAEV